MKFKQSNPRAEALRVLELRIEELSVRLAHAELERNIDKVISLKKKLARTVAQKIQLQKKVQKKA